MVKDNKTWPVRYFGKYYSKNKMEKMDFNSIKKYKLDDEVIRKKGRNIKNL